MIGKWRNEATGHDRKATGMQSQIRRFTDADCGSMASVFVLTLPLLIGAAAFGVEVSSWLMLRQKTQNAADMAAFSGAVNYSLTSDRQEAIARAEQVSYGSGISQAGSRVDVTFIGDSGVAVDITATYPRYFTRLFMSDPVSIHARAVADFVTGESAATCLIVLEDRDDETLNLGGGAEIAMPGCAIEVHSSDDNALDVSGTAEIIAACLSVAAASVNDQDARQQSTLGCRDIVTDAPLDGRLPERLQQIVEREEDSIRSFVRRVPRYRGDRFIEDATLSPEDVGHSSGIPMMRFTRDVTLSGEITLMPGIYILDDAQMSTRNRTILNASAGVMFYLYDGGELDLHSGTEADLRGLDDFEGSIFQDVVLLDEGESRSYTFEAGEWTGIILTPRSEIEIRGGRAISGCFLFAANSFSLGGNARLDLDCEESAFDPSLYDGSGGGPGTGGTNAVIRLIE